MLSQRLSVQKSRLPSVLAQEEGFGSQAGPEALACCCSHSRTFSAAAKIHPQKIGPGQGRGLSRKAMSVLCLSLVPIQSLRPTRRPPFSPTLLGEDKGAGQVRVHGGSAQGAHRASGRAASRLEGTEVMCPQEVLGSLLHGSQIQAAAGSQMSGQEKGANQVGLATSSSSTTPTLTLPAGPSIDFVQTRAVGHTGGSRWPGGTHRSWMWQHGGHGSRRAHGRPELPCGSEVRHSRAA